MKVKERARKEKKLICFWKCVEYKHIAFVTRSTENNFGIGHKLKKYFTIPLPLKKINFFDSRLASCVLHFYLLIKFGI